ncbi:MAG: aspartate kinase [Verrucomicrobiota bacterium]|nr:aspartate kinase [Verrucomicrobiota bacterium]
MANHTVEKIGGTSMSSFEDILENIIFLNRSNENLYDRVFVVSAYSGITDMLLEHKKTDKPGVFGYFAEGNSKWKRALLEVEEKVCEINAGLEGLGLNVKEANAFICKRINTTRTCLYDLMRLCSYGHFYIQDYLSPCREMLSSLGEVHSAYNSTEILKSKDVNAVFVDLSGWQDEKTMTIEEKIADSFIGIDIATQMPIVTGYTKCKNGIMSSFDRGYSEVTFSKLAVVTKAKEGIIHKEYHLSTGDPKLIGEDKVKIIGETNFDIADQLADMGMEAIHPKASKDMEMNKIPIRIKNTFEPENPGTLIDNDYMSPNCRVEMVAGRSDILAVEVMDPDMVAEPGYDYRILSSLNKYKISFIAKNTNANTITHYIAEGSRNLDEAVQDVRKNFPQATIRTVDVALIAATGSNMKVPGLLAKAAGALADAQVNILAFDQCMRQVNMQFIISRDDFSEALKVLHKAVVEDI